MQEEKIYTQLYEGFAVVKETYKMMNTSSEKLSFKMGYPIKGVFYSSNADTNEVELDSINKFKVTSNSKELKINKTIQQKTDKVISFSNENWLTWQIDFY